MVIGKLQDGILFNWLLPIVTEVDRNSALRMEHIHNSHTATYRNLCKIVESIVQFNDDRIFVVQQAPDFGDDWLNPRMPIDPKEIAQWLHDNFEDADYSLLDFNNAGCDVFVLMFRDTAHAAMFKMRFG